MSVKLAKNGTWLAQFRCKDKFGNEVHKCKRGFATAEEAQAWEDEFITSTGCTMEMTFGEFFKVHEADLRPRLREHTWRQKEYAIKSRVLPFFANKKMDKIRTIDIVRWQNTLMARPRKRRQALQRHVPAHAQQPADRHSEPRGEVLRAELQPGDENREDGRQGSPHDEFLGQGRVSEVL